MEKNYTYKILDNLPSFYAKNSDSTNYNVMGAIGDELDIQKIQQTNMVSEIQIDTSTSVYLDSIGALFRLLRFSDEDDINFRVRIKSHWSGIVGGGTIPSIKSALSNLTGTSTSHITVTEAYNMIIKASVPINNFNVSNSLGTVDDTLQKSKAAGIYAFAEVVPFYDFTEPFDNTDDINANETNAVVSGGVCTFTPSAIGLPKQLTSTNVIQSIEGNFQEVRITGTFTGTVDKIYVSVDETNWEDAGNLFGGFSYVHLFTNLGTDFYYKVIARNAVVSNLYFEFTVEGV